MYIDMNMQLLFTRHCIVTLPVETGVVYQELHCKCTCKYSKCLPGIVLQYECL